MKKTNVSRREFIGLGAVTGASLLVPPVLLDPREWRWTRPAAPVRFGIIGVGMQGAGLLSTSIALPDVECVAACDLWDGRHVLAREITRPDLPVTRRYQDLLNNRDIQALIVAVPDHWHRQIVVDAVAAGKDVYVEKPMSHNPADGVAMVDAAKKSGRIVQVGSQRVSSEICGKARELISQGAIGDLMLIEGWLGRNSPTGAWQYPTPPGLSPANLDWDTWLGRAPKVPFSPAIFARWRQWKEYGTGVAGDLLVHLVSGMMYMADLNRAPTQATSVGGFRRWKDGRNMPDVHAVQFYYGDLPVSFRLNLGTDMPETYRFQGSRGVLEVTGSTISLSPQSGKDDYPSYYAYGFPREMREAYFAEWRRANEPKPGDSRVTQTSAWRGPDMDDTRPHLWNFFEAVRTRKPVVQDALFGHHAALACHMANESFFRRAAVSWDAAAQVIKA